jgi:Ca2+-binding EF-hand superfamily protein
MLETLLDRNNQPITPGDTVEICSVFEKEYPERKSWRTQYKVYEKDKKLLIDMEHASGIELWIFSKEQREIVKL